MVEKNNCFVIGIARQFWRVFLIFGDIDFDTLSVKSL